MGRWAFHLSGGRLNPATWPPGCGPRGTWLSVRLACALARDVALCKGPQGSSAGVSGWTRPAVPWRPAQDRLFPPKMPETDVSSKTASIAAAINGATESTWILSIGAPWAEEACSSR